MKTILIDSDGVIVDFVSSFLRCYQYHGGFVPDDLDMSDYDFMTAMPAVYAKHDAWQDPSLFSGAQPYPGAAEKLWRS